jgi:hypothetical protein
MKRLSVLDMAQNAINNAQIQNLAAAPSSPVKGQVYFDTTLNQFGSYNGTSWIYLGGGGGTVTSASVVSANGFAGSVATPSSTPAITVSTTVTGLLKGNGTSVAAAVSGTDYAPVTSGTTSLKGNGSGGFSAATLNDNGAPTASFSMNSQKFTSLADPTLAQDAATKNYVDNTAQGLSPKPSVRVATTGAETFTIASGSATLINGLTVDGVTLSVSDRILIKDAPSATGVGSANSTQPANGTYTVTANTTNLTVARATDMDDANDVPTGAFVFVEAGTANSSAGFVVSSPSSGAAFTYGTTNVAWTQFSGAGEVVAGTGLTKVGNTLSVTTTTTHKYTATIGDGSTTSISVTDGLGSIDKVAVVRDATTAAQIECDITYTSTQVTFGFTTAPATNAYKVVVVG